MEMGRGYDCFSLFYTMSAFFTVSEIWNWKPWDYKIWSDWFNAALYGGNMAMNVAATGL